MVQIRNFIEFPEKERSAVLENLRAVFFEAAAKKDFSSADERRDFFDRWAGYYISNCQDEIFCAYENDLFLGYLTGCRNSQAALNGLSRQLKSFAVFQDLFADYPAHLHINLSASARGKGVGSRLIEAYCSFLRSHGLEGVHLVTSPGVRNVGFYIKNGFSFQTEREFSDVPLLFMGRKLENK